MIAGCANLDDAAYTTVQELASAQDVFMISAEGQADLKVPVYSNGNVSIELVGNNTGWMTLDKMSFSGDDTLRVAVSENTGLRRMAKAFLTLDGGEKKDTLYFKQYGLVPHLDCSSPFATVDGRESNTLTYELETNLSPGELTTAVEYVSGPQGWISSVAFSQDGVTVNTKPTGSNGLSRASVLLKHIDSWEEEFSVTLFATASNKNGEFGTEISWEQARSLAGTGVISDDVYIKGVIISDCKSANMALNPSVSYNNVDITESMKTAYIQKEDGSLGFCLKFDDSKYNVLSKGSLVSLSLNGVKIEKIDTPERFILSGLRTDNIVESSVGTIVEKNKKISQLQDSDIYTCVRLQDTEFYCKYGAYANVNENYTLSSSINSMCSSNYKDRLDGWATMLVDKDGSAIYAPVNMLCEWRRSVDPTISVLVPQGNGITEGIIVSETNYRYGNYGKYQIRVVDNTGFRQPFDGESAYTEYVRYNGQPYSYRYGQYAAINTEYAAPAGLEKRMRMAIPSDDISQSKKIPNAELTCENWSAASSLTDSNYPMSSYDAYCSPFCTNVSVGKAGVASTDNSTGHPRSLLLVHEIKGWYDWNENQITGYRGVVVKMDASTIQGTNILFTFAFSAGKTSASTSQNFPAHWCVECSVDGGESWTLCKDVVTANDFVHLRALPWADTTIGGAQYVTSAGCGLGATEHCFRLPDAAFGNSAVFIKIRPYDDVMSVLPLAWNGDVENGKVSSKTKADTYISFDYISVRYR